MKILRVNLGATIVCIAVLILASFPCWAQSDDAQVVSLANKLADQALEYDPTLSYNTGLAAPTQSHFADHSAKGIANFAREETEDLNVLQRINIGHVSEAVRPTLAILKEKLTSDLQQRICRRELWDVDHFNGWPATMPQIASHQQVDTAGNRQEALQRWSTFSGYVDTDVTNLRTGLQLGYSAPKSVVRRVLKQLDQLTPSDPSQSPLYAPAAHTTDAAFRAAYTALLNASIYPAIERYRQFLQTEYLPAARDGVALSELPDGRSCYAALLRTETTLTRSPEAVFALGQQTVAANTTIIKKVAKEQYGTTDLAATLSAIQKRPSEHFASADGLLAFSRDFVERTRAITEARILSPLPKQRVEVEPLSRLEGDSGGNSRFQSEADPAKPSKYLIQLSLWSTEPRAQAEIVAVHEGFPGHALQKAVAFLRPAGTRLSPLAENSAFDEGWARYAEYLGEEQGIYDTPDARILRRLWPAHGMVVDPGLHVFGWTRQQAIDYIVAAGRDTPEAANDLVDRIAVMPGQLTSYDSGGLEILALRHEAETHLGSRFNLKTFDSVVLSEGSVPLGELRRHVEEWVTESSGGPQTDWSHTAKARTSKGEGK